MLPSESSKLITCPPQQPPGDRNSVYCQKIAKSPQLKGLVQAQSPAAPKNIFFDPKVSGNVLLGSARQSLALRLPFVTADHILRLANTIPFGLPGSAFDNSTGKTNPSASDDISSHSESSSTQSSITAQPTTPGDAVGTQASKDPKSRPTDSGATGAGSANDTKVAAAAASVVTATAFVTTTIQDNQVTSGASAETGIDGSAVIFPSTSASAVPTTPPPSNASPLAQDPPANPVATPPAGAEAVEAVGFVGPARARRSFGSRAQRGHMVRGRMPLPLRRSFRRVVRRQYAYPVPVSSSAAPAAGAVVATGLGAAFVSSGTVGVPMSSAAANSSPAAASAATSGSGLGAAFVSSSLPGQQMASTSTSSSSASAIQSGGLGLVPVASSSVEVASATQSGSVAGAASSQATSTSSTTKRAKATGSKSVDPAAASAKSSKQTSSSSSQPSDSPFVSLGGAGGSDGSDGQQATDAGSSGPSSALDTSAVAVASPSPTDAAAANPTPSVETGDGNDVKTETATTAFTVTTTVTAAAASADASATSSADPASATPAE